MPQPKKHAKPNATVASLFASTRSLSPMKLSDLIELETETISALRARAQNGDNHAARVLLEHLRKTSEALSQWKRNKELDEQHRKPNAS